MENKINQERKFVCLDNVSKFLYCSICDDIFRNPVRLKTCGHTYCLNCIIQWARHNLNCPLCRVSFTDTDIKKDIIATNIINDLEIYCVNLGCPWKGKLKDFSDHLNNCYFNPNEVPEYIKEILDNKPKEENKDENKESDSDEEEADGNLTSFNTKSSLRARLYNRNRELVKNVFAKTDDGNKIESDILNILKENEINKNKRIATKEMQIKMKFKMKIKMIKIVKKKLYIEQKNIRKTSIISQDYYIK